MGILVGYVSPHGSTKETAERIGQRLVKGGHHVDICPLSEAGDLASYDAYVLGSAIHNGNWMPEAIEFLDANVKHLKGNPAWLFSVGMQDATVLSRRFPSRAPKAIANIQLSLNVRDHRVFGGVFRREDNTLIGHLILEVMIGHYGDYRDWDAIDHWAAGIAGQLMPKATQAA
jgi:menaquinone-dependent protoporphyrinogen oxidase